jgi:hypothetical protein
MLASTVQFSNNDQPPITPPLQASSLGPASRKYRPKSVPSDTQQCARPDRYNNHFPRRSSTRDPNRSCRIVNVPPMSNQHRTFADVLASDQAETR